ncbi:MAG: Wzz/FepE/Etk N-terminal domain-containing protein, partial [Deinococcales bacterium]
MESSSEEISLRDVYLVLKRNLVLILGFSLGLGALVLLLSFVLPANFSSQVVINLAVDNGRSEFKAAPNVLGLSQGFIQLVNNESLAEKLGEERLGNHYKAKFDEKKSLLTLSSQGSTAQQAFERAKRFEQAAIEYFNAQLSAIVKTNIGATLVQTKLDIANTKDNLKRLEPLLQNSQFV